MSHFDYSRRFKLTYNDMFPGNGTAGEVRPGLRKPPGPRRNLSKIQIEVATYMEGNKGPGSYALRALKRGGVLERTAYFTETTGRQLDSASLAAAYGWVATLRGARGFSLLEVEIWTTYLNRGRPGSGRAPDVKNFCGERVKLANLCFAKGAAVSARFRDAYMPEMRRCVDLARSTFRSTITS